MVLSEQGNGRCPRDVYNIHSLTDTLYCVRDKVYFHIGVGFDVARSSIPGNARAFRRGTGNRMFHAFFAPKLVWTFC